MPNRFAVALVALVFSITMLSAGPAFAQKSGSDDDKLGISDHSIQIGMGLGLNLGGALLYGDLEKKVGSISETGDISADLKLGPSLSLFLNYNYLKFIFRGEMSYGYKEGSLNANFDPADFEDDEFNFQVHDFKIGVGFGRTLYEHPIAHPYLIGVCDYHYMAFSDFQWEKSSSASAVGVGLVAGVDAKFLKKYFAGGGFRADFLFPFDGFSYENNSQSRKVEMGLMPVMFFINAGYLF